ncbi:unnamed protein product [Ectocarpus fasciculatus]
MPRCKPAVMSPHAQKRNGLQDGRWCSVSLCELWTKKREIRSKTRVWKRWKRITTPKTTEESRMTSLPWMRTTSEGSDRGAGAGRARPRATRARTRERRTLGKIVRTVVVPTTRNSARAVSHTLSEAATGYSSGQGRRERAKVQEPAPGPLRIDERALGVSGRGDGCEHRGAGVEAPAAGLLFRVRLPRAVHVHAVRVSVLQFQVLRAAQGDTLSQVRIVDFVNPLYRVVEDATYSRDRDEKQTGGGVTAVANLPFSVPLGSIQLPVLSVALCVFRRVNINIFFAGRGASVFSQGGRRCSQGPMHETKKNGLCRRSVYLFLVRRAAQWLFRRNDRSD